MSVQSFAKKLLAMSTTTVVMTAVTFVALATVAPSAQAVARYENCVHGSNIDRCVWISWDAANSRYRAHAHAHDVSGRLYDYFVAVHSLTFSSSRGSTTYSPTDGWHPVEDFEQSKLGHCSGARNLTVTATASFGWRLGYNGAIGNQTLSVTHRVC